MLTKNDNHLNNYDQKMIILNCDVFSLIVNLLCSCALKNLFYVFNLNKEIKKSNLLPILVERLRFLLEGKKVYNSLISRYFSLQNPLTDLDIVSYNDNFNLDQLAKYNKVKKFYNFFVVHHNLVIGGRFYLLNLRILENNLIPRIEYVRALLKLDLKLYYLDFIMIIKSYPEFFDQAIIKLDSINLEWYLRDENRINELMKNRMRKYFQN